MGQFGYPAAYALFVWWFSTGLIILLDNLNPRTFRWSMLGGTLVFGVALHRLAITAADTSIAGAYAAFTYAVLAWGWQEMSFFMGFLTGPRRTGTDAAPGGWRHFVHGVQACLHHELAIIATATAIVALTWGQPNQVGTWTFMLLWAMRQSAKLNFFLGVRNLGEQFIPAHLTYLKAYLRQRPMNNLMPISIGGGVAVMLFLVRAAAAPGISEASAAGLSFLITMLALAVLEHLMLVLPIPFDRLWNWVLRLKGDQRIIRHGASPRPRGASHELRILLP